MFPFETSLFETSVLKKAHILYLLSPDSIVFTLSVYVNVLNFPLEMKFLKLKSSKAF